MNKQNGKDRSATKKLQRRLREKYLPVSKPAKASKYLHCLEEYIKKYPVIWVIIYIRVSTGPQGNKNLDTYEKVLRSILKKLNIHVLCCYREIGSGWVLDEDRLPLVNAVNEAKRRQAVIITTSADRFLRNIDFHTKQNSDALPTEAEFELLKELTNNVPLLTLLRPDMSPRKVRGYVTKWGQNAKGNKGGRPTENKSGYKKQKRHDCLSHVLTLRKKGYSWGDIVKATGIPKTTAWDWVRKNRK